MPMMSGTPRWQKIATFVLLGAILLTVIYVANSSVSTNASVNATKESVDRTDCARKVNAEQSAVRDAATIADRAERRYLDTVLLSQVTDGPPTAETQARRVTEFTALVAAAENADRAVKGLPDPAKEVNRRCPG